MLVGFVWFGLARYLLGLFGFWFERSVGLPREMHIYPLGGAVFFGLAWLGVGWVCLDFGSVLLLVCPEKCIYTHLVRP